MTAYKQRKSPVNGRVLCVIAILVVTDKVLHVRYGGMFVIGMAYRGTANNAAIQKLLHFAVSDVSDDVRRAAVLCLGFVLLGVPEQCPRIVSLLSQSYNPHVRYGAAMAVGICCSGTGKAVAHCTSAFDLSHAMRLFVIHAVVHGARWTSFHSGKLHESVYAVCTLHVHSLQFLTRFCIISSWVHICLQSAFKLFVDKLFVDVQACRMQLTCCILF